MFVEPVTDVWHTRDQQHGPAALFPVDGHLEPVVVVRYVADSEVAKLKAPESGFQPLFDGLTRYSTGESPL